MRRRSPPPIESLGVVKPSCLLGDDGEVVEGIGQVRMGRAELGFLDARDVSQQFIGGGKVASRRRLSCGLEHASSVLQVRH